MLATNFKTHGYELHSLLKEFEIQEHPMTKSWRPTRRAALDVSIGISLHFERQVGREIPDHLGHSFGLGVPNEEYTMENMTQKSRWKMMIAWVRTQNPG